MRSHPALPPAFITLLLTACGSENTAQTPYEWELMPLPPEHLVGIWEQTRPIKGVDNKEVLAIDKRIIVITDQGEYIEYDDKADEFSSINNDFANCYRKSNHGAIRQKTENRYTVFLGINSPVTISYDMAFDLEGEELQVTSYLTTPESKTNATSSSLTFIDLQSLTCE